MTPCANSFENNSNIHLTLSQAPVHSQPSRHMNDRHFRAHTDVVIWLIKDPNYLMKFVKFFFDVDFNKKIFEMFF